MSKIAHAALIAATLFVLSNPAYADHAGLGGGINAAGPVNVTPAATAHPGHISFGLNSEFVKSRPFSDDQLIEKASQHIHAHSADYLLTTSLSASYSPTANLMLSTHVPYITRENIRSGAHSHNGGVTTNSVDDNGDAGGIGDITLSGKYRFWNKNSLQLALLFGLKIPTGETGKKHDDEKLEAEHQPGSGSWDPQLGLAVTKQWGGYSFDASALYSLATEGSQDTDLGDRASYGVAVSKRLYHENHRSLDLALELNGEGYGYEKEAGTRDPDSGGNLLFVSPGIRYTVNRWSGQLSVGLPVANNMRDGHSDTDYKITAGIGLAF